LKPENVCLVTQSREVAKVLDFGIAGFGRRRRDPLTTLGGGGARRHTLCIAPEQLRGRVRTRLTCGPTVMTFGC
jgi:hypothetical protein